MKKKFITMAVAIISVFTASLPAKAFDLKDILGGNGGGIVGNLLEGVFTKTDLTTKDLMGVWTTDKPAVSFKSEDMLKKAGGMAAAAALETKLTPYFEQFGLNGATLTVNADSTFSLKSKRLNLSGTISQRNDGIFLFNIKAFGKISLGEIPAYVQKTSKSMEVMFDSSKLKSIAHTIAKFIDIKSLSTLTGLLDSYDGMYVGFGMDKTGNVEGEPSKGSGLLDILTGGKSGNKNSGSTNADNDKQSGQDQTNGSAGSILRDILSGSKKKYVPNYP